MTTLEKQIEVAKLESELKTLIETNKVLEKLVQSDCIHCVELKNKIRDAKKRHVDLFETLGKYISTTKNSRNAGRKKAE